MCFDADLEFGQKYEVEAMKLLEYDRIRRKTGKFSPYDFEIFRGSTMIKVEVKSDRLGVKTGNIAIEVECNGRKSGLNTTQADLWMYFLVNGDRFVCLKLPTSDLKRITKSRNYRTIYGGDGKKSKIVLIPYMELAKYVLN